MSSDPDHKYRADVGEPPCQYLSLHGENLTCQHVSLARPVPRHQHDFHLIVFALAGSGVHEDEGGRLPFLVGDVCVVQPGQWHAYPRTQGSLSLLNLAISRSFLVNCGPLLDETPWLEVPPAGEVAPLPDSSVPAHVRLSSFDLGLLRPLLLALAAEGDYPSPYTQPSVRAGMLLQILGWLGHRSQRSVVGMGSFDEGTEEGGILGAIRYLEERYMGPLAIEELAEHTGYTRTYLARKFRLRLGLSPSEYLLHLRLQHACTLLRDTNLPVASIANQVGFRDNQHLDRRFRQILGVTPSAFRTLQDTFSHAMATQSATGRGVASTTVKDIQAVDDPFGSG